MFCDSFARVCVLCVWMTLKPAQHGLIRTDVTGGNCININTCMYDTMSGDNLMEFDIQFEMSFSTIFKLSHRELFRNRINRKLICPCVSLCGRYVKN